MLDLVSRRCVPCEGGTPPLPREEAERLQTAIPRWDFDETGKAIRRAFKFKGFKEVMAFVNAVADLAEAEGHHPDIAIRFQRVTFTLSTHAIGGLSENDFILAAKIDRLHQDTSSRAAATTTEP